MKRSDRFNGQVTVTGTVHPSQKIIATWNAKVSWDASGYVVLMKDLGAPVTWSALPVGVPVFDRDGPVPASWSTCWPMPAATSSTV